VGVGGCVFVCIVGGGGGGVGGAFQIIKEVQFDH